MVLVPGALRRAVLPGAAATRPSVEGRVGDREVVVVQAAKLGAAIVLTRFRGNVIDCGLAVGGDGYLEGFVVGRDCRPLGLSSGQWVKEGALEDGWGGMAMLPFWWMGWLYCGQRR